MALTPAERRANYARLRAEGYSREYARRNDKLSPKQLAKAEARSPKAREQRRAAYQRITKALRDAGVSAKDARDYARKHDKAARSEVDLIVRDAARYGPNTAREQADLRARAAGGQGQASLPTWYLETTRKMDNVLARLRRDVKAGRMEQEEYDARRAEAAEVRRILRIKARLGPGGPTLQEYHFINDDDGFFETYFGDEDWDELYGSEEVD